MIGFQTKTKNQFAKDPVCANLFSCRTINLASGSNQGIEISASSVWDKTSLRASLTLQNPINDETKKILDKNIKLTATCVRIPVLVSHSESVNLQFEKSFNLEEVRSVLSKAEGCKVIDERKDGGYITPFEAEGKFETYISRMRVDHTENNCLNLWIVSDNLLKGAALNAVQIAETLINKKLI